MPRGTTNGDSSNKKYLGVLDTMSIGIAKFSKTTFFFGIVTTHTKVHMESSGRHGMICYGHWIVKHAT